MYVCVCVCVCCAKKTSVLSVVIQTRHDGLCQVQSGNRIGWVHMRILKEIPQPLPVTRPPPAHTHRKLSESSSEPSSTTLTSPPPGEERIVTVHFSNKGYGFAMRGVKGEWMT